MRVEGTEAGNRVCTAVGTMETVLCDTTWVNQFSFISESSRYIRLESLGKNPILH